MRRRPQTQWKYLLNIDEDNKEVHDLDNEKTSCQIGEIITANNARYLKEATNESELVQWLRQNPDYDGCAYCLQHHHRK